MLKNRPQLRQYLQVTSWYFDGLILSRFVKFNLLQAKSTLPANNLKLTGFHADCTTAIL